MLKRAAAFLTHLKTGTWLAIVTLIAVIERVWLYLAYRPVLFNDTAGYRKTARAILNGWKTINGTRVPGYPAFLAVLGEDERVYLVQLILGLTTTLFLFYLGWRVSRKGWVGAAVALAHSLNLGQLFFEADLITESLATFFVVTCLAWTAWLMIADKPRPLWQAAGAGLGAGVMAGVLTLVRPNFFFLPLWLPFFLLVFWKPAAARARWTAALAAAAAGIFVVGLWVNLVHQRFGIWSLSVMNGYNLVQHAGLYFEYLPEEYAAIRDTYLQYRQERMLTSGVPGNAIWDAIPALEQVSGLGFIPLSNLLAKLSLQLIWQHPLLYLGNVATGWLWFWKAPVYWSAESVASPPVRQILSTIIQAQRGGMIAGNILFVLGSISLLFGRLRKRLRLPAFAWFVTTTIWFTSILQTLLDHGDNPRFSVPIQSLVAFMLLWWAFSLWNRKNYENHPA